MTQYLYEFASAIDSRRGHSSVAHSVTPPEGEFFCAPLMFPGTFSLSECRTIVDLGLSSSPVIAGLSKPLEDYRTGLNRTIVRSAASEWLYQKIDHLFNAVNQWYQYQIAGFAESLLFCEYPPGAHFHWHLDAGASPTGTRKISISIQLSDKSDYEGGALEFASVGELSEARSIGTSIAFPSFQYHRVTPVTGGTRRSLVAWAHGPVFR